MTAINTQGGLVAAVVLAMAAAVAGDDKASAPADQNGALPPVADFPKDYKGTPFADAKSLSDNRLRRGGQSPFPPRTPEKGTVPDGSARDPWNAHVRLLRPRR